MPDEKASKAAFAAKDTNKDGKLSRDELAAMPFPFGGQGGQGGRRGEGRGAEGARRPPVEE